MVILNWTDVVLSTMDYCTDYVLLVQMGKIFFLLSLYVLPLLESRSHIVLSSILSRVGLHLAPRLFRLFLPLSTFDPRQVDDATVFCPVYPTPTSPTSTTVTTNHWILTHLKSALLSLPDY